MWKSRLAGIALLGMSAGIGPTVLPTAALAAPTDPTTAKTSQSAPATKKGVPASGTVVFSTAQSRFDADVNNSGWWSAGADNSDSNDNYIVGPYRADYRNFFTFDVRALPKHVVSATLRLNTAETSNLTGPEVLRLSDVSTDAATLNENVGQNEKIFADLGTGAVYGEYRVGELGEGQSLSLELNKAALHDLKHAAKHGPGFFSIGGSLLNAPQGTFVFGSSGSLPVELVVQTRSKRSTSRPASE